MKTSEFSGKIRRLIAILALTFMSSAGIFAQTTITSTTAGGDSRTASTWVGGLVPTAANHVVIAGSVYLNGDFACTNLTINAAGSIFNQFGYSPTLTVTGKLINNGKISKHPNGYSLYLSVLNDIENNGIWTPDKTTFSGKSTQNVKEAVGKIYQGGFQTDNTLGQIVLGSDVTFDSNTWNWNGSTLSTNGFKLTTLNYQLNNGTITSNDNMVLKNTGIAAMTFNGNYKIDGKVRVQGDNVFNGTATILDTLNNEFGYSPTITVNGKLINNGKIISNPKGYALYLNIYNDIENNGIWAPRQTAFVGNNNQRLKEAAGKTFQGYFVTTDSIGEIILDSDVLFSGNTWDMSKCKVTANGFNLTTKDYLLRDGRIYSNNSLILRNTNIAAMTFSGNYKVGGLVRVRGDNVFNGTLTVLDTLYNEFGYSPTITMNAKIINNGKIISNPSGYSLYLNILSDIENNGKWAPNQTTFLRNSDQNIKQSAGKSFQGYFLTTDTLGQIVLGSDVTFDSNTWDWNKSKLRTNGFKLTTLNYQLNNGTIVSNDNLILKNTGIAAMTFNGNYKIDGRLRIQGDNVFNGTVTVLDTLNNEFGYSPTLTVNAKIINNGKIISHPSGYSLYLNVLNDIENNGKWAPYQTTFSGKTDQKLKQTPGKSFQGYFLTTDTLGQIILQSNVAFLGNTWDWNRSKLRTNGFKLTAQNYQLNNGIINSNDSLALRNCSIAAMTFSGNFKVSGKFRVRGDNVFSGTTTVLDTLYNEFGYSPTLTISGNLINNGTVSNHPSGYSLYLSINGNLENNKKISVSSIYLTGTNDRTISGRSANTTSGTFYADNAIGLIGENIFPNLNFTGSPTAGCTVKKGATLTLLLLPNSAKMKNYGRISVAQDVDNTANNTYNFYAASSNTKSKTLITKLLVDNYGYQQHPTATGTINTWWRLRNTPQLFNDSLNWLKLTYLDDALNGIIEDSIKVFHSPNSGLTWKRIKKGYTIDKASNTVTINKAPSYGHYLLSNSALGITSFQPLVESAEPRFGGNTGQLTMYVFGAGFKKTSTVKLQLTGQSDIKADSTWLTDALGEAMLAKFDLKNKTLGIYNVIIETPGEKTLTLPAYFTIMAGERSDPWSTLSGRNRFLINRWQTFTINCGNTANTDARGTVLSYVVNDLPGLEVDFPDINIVLPNSVRKLDPVYLKIPEWAPIYYVTNTLTGYEGQAMRVYPFYIPVLAAGSTNSVRVKVKLNGPGSLKMDSWIMDPLYEPIDNRLKKADPSIPMEVRACITFHAEKYAVQQLTGGLPVLSCLPMLDKLYPPENYLPDYMVPEEKPYTWGSFIWDFASAGLSIGQCASGFFPGPGTALSYGLSVVGGLMDMKENSDINEGCWRKFRKRSKGKLDSNGVTSMDPNEMAGPRGYTTDHYISKEGNLNYTIFFENKKTAGASALEVFVTDTLDVKKFDFSTFSFSSVTFGETTAKIQEFAKEFKILIDLYPKKNIIVQVHGVLDPIKGIVSWDFHSLDRISMELTEDPDLGFLPPNKIGPEGEGNVTFSCKLKDSVAHGDVISNRASIVFDFNAAILTNTFTNRIDAMAPVSLVTPLSISQKDTTFSVAWNGSDQGSKISKFNIFVSTNDKGYVLWKAASTPGEAKFTGKNGSKYKFISEATDSIGFVEQMKEKADATTTIYVTSSRNINSADDEIQVFPNPAKTKCSVSFNFNSSSDISISLVDISGKIIKSVDKQRYQAGKQTVEINLDGIPKGVYVVKLFNNKDTYHQKLVIR